MRILFTALFIAALHLGCAQKKATEDKGKSDGCLDYSFGEEYPHAYKLYKDKIIVGDGRRLISFDKSGKEVSRITVPTTFRGGSDFLDFLPLSDSSYLIAAYTDLCIVTAKTQKLLSPKFGELIRGELPIVVGNFQEVDTASNTVNGMRLLDQKISRVSTYPIKADLGTYNFEIVDGNIALCNPNNKFYLLPLDTTKKTQVFDIPFDTSIGYYSFLGINGGNYVFLTRDYNKKEDHLHFYDAGLGFVSEAVLDVPYEEISDVFKRSDDFYMEAPFGNFYTFDNKTGTVYAFRLTKKGICYFPIEKHLRVVRKAK